MDIEVWTDGWYRDNMYVSSAMVLTKDVFITRVIKTGSAKVPYESEIYAILAVLEYLSEVDTTQFNHINIYTDAAFVAQSFNMLMGNRKAKKAIKFRDVFLRMIDLASAIECTVATVTYPSHLVEHNPNKTCDITCRIISSAMTS